MNYLIGDIGNTSLKICKINNKFRIVKTFFFRTKSVYLEKDLKKKSINLQKITSVIKFYFQVLSQMFIEKLIKYLEKKILRFLR